MEKRVDEVFMEALTAILRAPGESSRDFVIKLAVGLCKGLALEGKRGDATIIASKMGISRGFAKKILYATLQGTEESLKTRKKRSSAFESTEWPPKFKEFVFRPENSRPVPGDKKKTKQTDKLYLFKKISIIL